MCRKRKGGVYPFHSNRLPTRTNFEDISKEIGEGPQYRVYRTSVLRQICSRVLCEYEIYNMCNMQNICDGKNWYVRTR